MEYDRKYIRPADLKTGDIPGVHDDSVLEIVGDEDGGFHFESRAKGLNDDLDLGLIPALLEEPELFNELIGQMERGEIMDVSQSQNPRVQELIEQYRITAEAVGYHNPYLSPAHNRGSFIQKAVNGVKNSIGRIFH